MTEATTAAIVTAALMRPVTGSGSPHLVQIALVLAAVMLACGFSWYVQRRS